MSALEDEKKNKKTPLDIVINTWTIQKIEPVHHRFPDRFMSGTRNIHRNYEKVYIEVLIKTRVEGKETDGHF